MEVYTIWIDIKLMLYLMAFRDKNGPVKTEVSIWPFLRNIYFFFNKREHTKRKHFKYML